MASYYTVIIDEQGCVYDYGIIQYGMRELDERKHYASMLFAQCHGEQVADVIFQKAYVHELANIYEARHFEEAYTNSDDVTRLAFCALHATEKQRQLVALKVHFGINFEELGERYEREVIEALSELSRGFYEARISRDHFRNVWNTYKARQARVNA